MTSIRPRRPGRRLRSFGAAALAIALSVSLAACAGSDTIVTGSRPTPGQPPGTTLTRRAALALSALPGYQAPRALGDATFGRALLGASGDITWTVYNSQNNPVENVDRTRKVAWGSGSEYTDVPGVLTFRGNNARSAPTYGTAQITEKKLSIEWTHDIGAVSADGSYFPGAGWTGQPLLVKWPSDTKQAMKLSAANVADDNFVEVIYPVFDGSVYRLSLADGSVTRPKIEGKWGFKGTGSIDPRGYPLLYAGQGLNENGSDKGPWNYHIFDLIKNKEVATISGTDEVSHRQDPVGWGAFDSSALVDRKSDTLIEPGENGIVYQAKLNASFDAKAGTVSVNPTLTKMTYRTPLSRQYGIESSAAAWKNLMWATDNDGLMVCWDARTLEIVWARALGDNSDSTPVLDDSTGHPYLYTGNSVGWRGSERRDQVANLRKIDGLTGDIVWQYDLPAYYDFHVKGGLLSTPLLGQGEVSDLVFFNVGKTTAPSEGTLVALDQRTGQVAWSRDVAHYSWSSPVLIHGADGHEYGVFGDSAGLLHLFDPNTGRDYTTISLGANVEASVAAYDNMIVVASYDQKIFGIRVS
ncbi:PQQ-binding-like beta-propeller repeat protein [Micropruina sp.]|uniref:outer membrane protein assembly factor BamB family protein n=1 Tax=Micropruina sp. TaxID=2737536 RepID=UPI0039E3B999